MLALKGDGTVVAWAATAPGSRRCRPGLTGVTAIAGGFVTASRKAQHPCLERGRSLIVRPPMKRHNQECESCAGYGIGRRTYRTGKRGSQRFGRLLAQLAVVIAWDDSDVQRSEQSDYFGEAE